MKPYLLMRAATSARLEVKIVIGVLAFIVFLPVMTIFVVAHSSLSILSSAAADALYQGPVLATDTYAYGNCTYWADLLRIQAGKPIPQTWGNANTWALNAQLGGYLVDHTPSATAIMQTSGGALGHVAFVESVDPSSGAWTISEMNVKGFDIIDTQTLPASSAKYFSFIHDKVLAP